MRKKKKMEFLLRNTGAHVSKSSMDGYVIDAVPT